MAGKKQAPAKFEEPDDTEGWDDAVVDDGKESEADLRLRDWRDVERYREMKELRRLVDDDYGLEEIFQLPVRARSEPAKAKNAQVAKPPAAGKTAVAGKAPVASAEKAGKAAAKKPAKLKAKAKRR